jgi:hypothetical protein
MVTKHYEWAAFFAMIAGYLAAVIAYALLGRWLVYGTPNAAGDVGFFAAASLPVVIIAHILFVQLPSRYIKKVFFKLTLIPFALTSSIYGLALFSIAFGSFILRDIRLEHFTNSFTFLLLAVSAVNGFVFGLTLHTLWKPTQVNA